MAADHGCSGNIDIGRLGLFRGDPCVYLSACRISSANSLAVSGDLGAVSSVIRDSICSSSNVRRRALLHQFLHTFS